MSLSKRIDERVFKISLTEGEKNSLKKVLKEDTKPSGGIWWYLWLKPKWVFISFKESEYGEITHADVWSKYVVEKVAKHYKVNPDKVVGFESLRNTYTCFPRGRVWAKGDKFVISHGNDSPVSLAKLKNTVISEFNLVGFELNKRLVVTFDEHEQMLQEDMEVFTALTRERPWKSGGKRAEQLEDFDDE